MRFATVLAILASAATLQAAATCAAPGANASSSGPANSWDTSGNGMLTGAYSFRYVQYTVADQQGDISHAYALYGTITFDGISKYTITGMSLDSNTMAATPVTSIAGTYSIGACGFGFIINPISLLANSVSPDVIWGAVSQGGVFVGSTTETQSNFADLFIGAPVSSPTAPAQGTSSTLQGAYSVAYFNVPDGYVGDNVTAGFQMAPDGRGNIGTVNILMYQGSSGTSGNVIEPVNYSFSGGTGMLNFPYYGEAVSRTKDLYISPDGNFVFGGGPDAFDMFVGVRTSMVTSGTSIIRFGFGEGNFGGLYYQAGIDEIMSSTGGVLTGSLQTYYGALNAVSGAVLNHQRIVAPLCSPLQLAAYPPVAPAATPYQPFGYTSADTYSLAFGNNVGYTDAATGRQYVIGANGTIRLGFGTYPNLGISIALQAPASLTVTGAQLYINPIGVVNAASYAPYTAGISPGELIVIYGSNLGSATQVTVEGIAAQIVSATSQQVSLIVPLGITGPYAQIQVSNGQQNSNVVWEFVNKTAPGGLTQSQNGLGDGDVFHADLSLVTHSHSATAGETISIAVVGLNPSVAAGPGIGGPSGIGTTVPTYLLSATIGGKPATVNSIGSPSGGVYKLSLVVPSGVNGDLPLVISGQDGTTAQATIPVGTY